MPSILLIGILITQLFQTNKNVFIFRLVSVFNLRHKTKSLFYFQTCNYLQTYIMDLPELPLEIWELIFLHMTAKDCASFCLAFPRFKGLLENPTFNRRFMARFSDITCSDSLNMFRASREVCDFRPLVSFMCCAPMSDSSILPSGHCVFCISQPMLLTRSPFASSCYCKDHFSLWYNMNDYVIWKKGNDFDPSWLSPGWSWPTCGVDLEDETLRAYKKRKWKRTMERYYRTRYERYRRYEDSDSEED